MSSRRRSTNVTLNHISPQQTGGSVSARQQSSIVTNQESFHASATQTVETESPVDEISPQEVLLLPPRPTTPPQLPPGSCGLRRQSTRRNTNETHGSTSGERNPSQPPNAVPVPPPCSDSGPPPVGSRAAGDSSNLSGRPSLLRVICYLLPLVGFVSMLYVFTVYFAWSSRNYTAKWLITDENAVGSECDRPGQFILNDILQVAILGNVSRFDWLDTHRLSVTWSIVGLGEYGSKTVNRLSYRYPSNRQGSHWHRSVNRAVDIYLDEWVRIWLICLGITERWNASASKPAFSYDPARLPVTSLTGERFG